MSGRTVTTAITLACLVVVLGGMAAWGYHQVSKPLPKLELGDKTAKCSRAEITVQRYVRRGEITVSVFNAGAPKGFAGLTMTRFENIGFVPGAVANAPKGIHVRTAVVYTTRHDDQAAELVALTLGKHVQVKHSTKDYGPGVDVFVGRHQGKLRKHAPHRLKLDHPIKNCIPVD